MQDEIMRVLSHPVRRQVITAVNDHGGSIDLDTVGETTIMDASTWEEHQLLLVHNHLPKLDDHGIIQWDQESRTVKEGERYDEVESLLDPVPDGSEESFPSFGLLAISLLL